MRERRTKPSRISGIYDVFRFVLGPLLIVAVIAVGCRQQSEDERPPANVPFPSGVPTAAATATNEASPTASEQTRPTEFIISTDESISGAIMMLQPGDTLFMRGGSYTERIEVAPPSGTASQPITIAAYPGERPVIRGLLWLEEPRHLVIDGVNVVWDDERNDRSEHMVKIIGGSDVTLLNNEFWNARSHANILLTGGVRRWELLDCYIHDNRGTSDNQDHLIYVNEAYDGRIEGCILVNSPHGRAIKLGSLSGKEPYPDGIAVRYNTMIDNFGPSNIQLSYGARNCVIEKNIMIGSDAENVTAFKLRGRNNLVRDNVGFDAEAGMVVTSAKGVVDGGGNMYLDPRLDMNFMPQYPAVTNSRGIPVIGHSAAR